MKHVWTNLRAVLAALVFLVLIAAFLGWEQPAAVALTSWQLLPALLAGSFLAAGAILLSALLFGRVSCSILCPLGIFQDFVNFWSARRKGKRLRFHFLKEQRRLRYGVLGVVAVAFFVGVTFFPLLLDPYIIFGRMVTHFLRPAFQTGLGKLAVLGETHGYGTLTRPDIIWQGTAGLVVAAGMLVILTILAWRWGRLYCQTICPVGTLLGTLSRFSVFRYRLDATKCVSCKLCERGCRSSCIDVAHQTIDASRCVVCGDCAAQCPKGAISFVPANPFAGRAENMPENSVPLDETAEPKSPILTRREVILTSAVALAGLAGAGSRQYVAGASPFRGGKPVVLPPGAQNRDRFTDICTACHLCIDQCPQQALTPSFLEYGLVGMLQPHLDFANGYCDVNCHRCADVCPTGALLSYPPEQKLRLTIGVAIFHEDRCLRATEGVTCDGVNPAGNFPRWKKTLASAAAAANITARPLRKRSSSTAG